MLDRIQWPRRIAALGGPASILALVLALPGASPRAAELQPELYFTNGGRLFKVDYTELLSEYARTATRAGSFTITLSRATFANDSRVPSDGTFLFADVPQPREFLVLGTRRDEAVRTAGKDPRDLRGWTPWLAYTLETTAGEVTVTYEAGPDRVAMTVPRAMIAAGPVEPGTLDVEIRVNETQAVADAALLLEMAARQAAGAKVPPLADPGLFQTLGAGFVNFPNFVNRVQGFALANQTGLGAGAKLPPIDSPSRPGSCFLPCMSCAGALLGDLATSIALVASCGAAVATAGGFTPACVGAFVAHQAANFVFVSACVSCGLCVQPTPPECPCSDEPVCYCS